MCDFDKEFILCVCKHERIPYKKTKRNKKKTQPEKIEYIWTLYKYIGPNKGKEMGRYVFPVSDIGNGLTSDFVLAQINSKNCFDFEYNPNEGDNLLISDLQYKGGRLEFIYRDGKWLKDFYDPFMDETKRTLEGKIKSVDNQNGR